MGDDDILAALPDPPPPAPRHREAAITEALARFDEARAAPRAVPGRSRAKADGWWAAIQRPQTGALVAAVLVVAISVPLALRMANQPAEITNEQPSSPTAEIAPPAASELADASSIDLSSTVVARAAPITERAGKDAAPLRESDAGENPVAAKAVTAPPPPVIVAQVDARGRAAAAKRSDSSDGVLIVSATRAAPSAPPPPPTAVAAYAPASDSAPDAAGEIMVTGARMAAPKRAPRGDWNACTVNDPSQNLSRCTKLVTQGNRKARDRAQGYLAEGLQNAWQGDAGDAVAAFDRAIAAAPQSSIAYLNRGLIYDRKGDLDRAIADLDQAVRYAPDGARAYYIRSLLLRKNGDDDRARADEKRAVELDPRYKAVVE